MPDGEIAPHGPAEGIPVAPSLEPELDAVQAPPPSTERWGAWSVLVPIAGALIVGIMARYGAAAIRGHGIPEVMERVLYNRSRISPKIMLLKPLSAAVAIGTGGPFGAEMRDGRAHARR